MAWTLVTAAGLIACGGDSLGPTEPDLTGRWSLSASTTWLYYYQLRAEVTPSGPVYTREGPGSCRIGAELELGREPGDGAAGVGAVLQGTLECSGIPPGGALFPQRDTLIALDGTPIEFSTEERCLDPYSPWGGCDSPLQTIVWLNFGDAVFEGGWRDMITDPFMSGEFFWVDSKNDRAWVLEGVWHARRR